MDPRLDFIYRRRSIRAYTARPLELELLEELLTAAMAAPTARNSRLLEFIVVTDAEVKQQLSTRHPSGDLVAACSAVIAVLGPAEHGYTEQEGGAATENILLAAAGLGLGACWLGMRGERQPPVRELLGIPDEVVVISLITVGYPEEAKEPRTQYDPAKVHWQRY